MIIEVMLNVWFRVGMYLRETRRTNKDGSVVRYLQLAHNTRNASTGGFDGEGDP